MIVALLLIANMVVNTTAHICFKRSAGGGGVKRFIFWQVLGNLGAFLGVLAYTALMRGMPLHVAYPLTQGLTAVGVQCVGGLLVLRERISPIVWVGTSIILAGVVLVSV